MRIPHFILFLLLAPLSAAGQTLQQREAERLADEAYVLEQGGHYAHASDLYARAYAKDDNPQYLLRAANTMLEANLDPSPLFEAIQATLSPELLWTDRQMLERLLADAEAPEDVRTWTLERVPSTPQTETGRATP